MQPNPPQHGPPPPCYDRPLPDDTAHGDVSDPIHSIAPSPLPNLLHSVVAVKAYRDTLTTAFGCSSQAARYLSSQGRKSR